MAGFVNGDFETGNLSGWAVSNLRNYTPVAEVGADYAHSGSYGMRFTINAPGTTSECTCESDYFTVTEFTNSIEFYYSCLLYTSDAADE